MALPEGAQRVLRLGELIRPVDRRLQIPALEHVGERLEVLLVELRDEELDRLLAEARREPDRRDVPQLAPATVRPHDDEPARRLETAPERAPRVAARDVGDQVVALPLAGEVDARVVEHAVGAERTRLLDVARAADGGHVRPERLRDLDGERPDAAGGSVDQHPLTGLEPAVIAQPLERGQSGDPHRRGLLERDVRRLPDDVGRAHVLGEGAVPAAEHLVAGREVGHVLPHGLHDSREVGAEEWALRPPHAVAGDGTQEARPATQLMPVGLVERARAHADEDAVVRQDRLIDLFHPHHAGAAVPVPNQCLHHRPLLHTP